MEIDACTSATSINGFVQVDVDIQLERLAVMPFALAQCVLPHLELARIRLRQCGRSLEWDVGTCRSSRLRDSG
jgi:hypothetical protein